MTGSERRGWGVHAGARGERLSPHRLLPGDDDVRDPGNVLHDDRVRKHRLLAVGAHAGADQLLHVRRHLASQHLHVTGLCARPHLVRIIKVELREDYIVTILVSHIFV